MGAIGKTPDAVQHTANGLLPSATFTHAPLNNYLKYVSAELQNLQNRRKNSKFSAVV
jgi:hypothetical protein